ncbi:diguanylate cyclase domain-containing protein [Phytohalomonas tamaricis]|uniref:diguanylate cyclase domain-containing protein n=1 Tax=Phytohalomonas tamaricis TaxID=2081032 RepID=UPI000D0ACBD7|nr:diguanylate cyclase [Phytohalomonas tamaricis]
MPKTTVSLQYRFIVALSLVLLMALAALAFISERIIVPSLLSEENNDAKASLMRVKQAISREAEHVGMLTRDWAAWDESYHFVEGNNPTYVEENLSRLILDDMKLMLIAYIDMNQHTVWVAGTDPDTQVYTSCAEAKGDCSWSVPIFEALVSDLPNQAGPVERDTLMVLPHLYLVAQRAIVKTDGTGPPVGTLVMMRAMDSEWLNHLSDETGIDMALISESGAGHGDDDIDLQRLDNDRLRAEMWLNALPNGYHLRLQAELPRERFRSGVRIYHFAMLWSAGLLLVVVLVVLILLRRMVLKPVTKLAAYAQQQREGDTYQRPAQALLERSDELGIMAQQFQYLIEHLHDRSANLFALSYLDALTGLGNRRLLDERLPEVLQINHEANRPVAMIMVDVDHFKAFNDHYGHPLGDRCLKQLAKALFKLFGVKSNLVIRLGGEEFIIVLPGVGQADAIQHANELRLSIERLSITHHHSPTSDCVTVSAGVAVSTSQRPLSAAALIDASDRALYKAKNEGRNSVGVFEE